MLKRFLLPVFCTLVGLTATLSCFAGGVEGSGGAGQQVYRNAWFQASQVNTAIKTCYLASTSFGVPSADLERSIRDAFAQWGAYLIKKQIEPAGKPISYNPPIYLTSLLDLRAHCVGDEDLKIYFGARDAVVDAALAHYDRPIGFAHRLNSESETWANGIVYVAEAKDVALPPWSEEDHLLGILLHEVGHIFGCAHVDGTIMDANVSALLRHPGTSPRISRIDGTHELLQCVWCPLTYRGTLNLGYVDHMGKAFNKLVGHAPTGLSSVRFTGRDQSGNAYGGINMSLPNGELVFTDLTGEHSFKIVGETLLSSGFGYASLFKTINFARSTPFGGESVLGYLQKPDGTRLPIAILLNTGNWLMSIKLIVPGAYYPEILFAGVEIR